MDSNTIRSSKMIIRAINKGIDVVFEDKIIEGDLILEGPKRIKSKLIIKSCIFNGRVNFHRVTFDEDIDFRGTIFQCETSFAASHFTKNAYFCSRSGEDYPFQYAQFHKYVDFECAHFYQDVNFHKVNFAEGVTFKSATFHRGAKPEFSFVNFGDDTEFVDITFEDTASFNHARFRGPVSFSSGTRFEKNVDFKETIFYERAYFLSCIFLEDADFGSASFGKGFLLDRSTFSRKLILDHVEAKMIRLLGSTFEDDSTLSLKGSYFDRLVVRWSIIEGHLDLNGNRIFTEEDIDAIFLSLVKSFKELGFFDDADKCYLQYRYRISERLKTESFRNRIPDWISYHFYGHGD